MTKNQRQELAAALAWDGFTGINIWVEHDTGKVMGNGSDWREGCNDAGLYNYSTAEVASDTFPYKAIPWNVNFQQYVNSHQRFHGKGCKAEF